MAVAQKCIFRFIHASDPHFGNLDANTGDSFLDVKAPKWWAWISWFQGFLGHHRRAIENFEISFRNLLGPKGTLVLTGDITANGNQDQFMLARTFFYWASAYQST